MTAWHRLEVKNQWMHLTYKLGERDIPLDQVARAEVRFPDGTTHRVMVFWRHRGGTYGDMGHTYPYKQSIPYFDMDVHGLRVMIDLADVQVGDYRETL